MLPGSDLAALLCFAFVSREPNRRAHAGGQFAQNGEFEMSFKRLILAVILVTPLLGASHSRAAAPVDLGTAGGFTILAKTGISTTGVTSIVGNIGVSPILAIGFTGFGQALDASNTFSTSALVIGKLFAPDYAPPTPANMTTAILDMQTAYTDAAGRAPTVTELGAGTLTGLTLAPGVYKWASGVTIPTDLTLAGSANAVWIFQIGGTLGISSAMKVVLRGGAQSKNVFWQVAGGVTLGSISEFKGVILGQTAIAMNNGAVLEGRALAQSAVTLIGNTVNGNTVSTLIDDTFSIEGALSDPNTNTCSVGVTGADFTTSGDATGPGTAAQVVRISYNAPLPTSSGRSEKSLTVKQRKLSTLNVLFDGVTATGGPLEIEKCSVNGSVSTSKLTGSVAVNCKMDTILALLSPAEIASIQTAFAGNARIKFKVDSTGTKGSLTVKCVGAATVD
jgi:hypothetical protein